MVNKHSIWYYVYRFDKFRKWAISKLKNVPEGTIISVNGDNGPEVTLTPSDIGAQEVGNYATVSELNDKQDSEEGKGLSTNDFTDTYKVLLDRLGIDGDGNLTIDGDIYPTQEP